MLSDREIFSKSKKTSLGAIGKKYELPINISKSKSNLVKQFESIDVPNEAKKELENLIKISKFAKNAFFVNIVVEAPKKLTIISRLKGNHRDEHKGKFSNIESKGNDRISGVYTYLEKELTMKPDGALTTFDKAIPVTFEINLKTKRLFLRAPTIDRARITRTALNSKGLQLTPFDYTQTQAAESQPTIRTWKKIAVKFLKKEGVEIE